MRLMDYQTQAIRQVAGNQARVRVFGSSRDDTAHRGDIDLMCLPINDIGFKEGQLL